MEGKDGLWIYGTVSLVKLLGVLSSGLMQGRKRIILSTTDQRNNEKEKNTTHHQELQYMQLLLQ